MPGDPYTAPPPDRPFAAEVGEPPGRLRIGVQSRLDEVAVDPQHAAAAVEVAGVLADLGHRVEERGPAALGEWRPFFFHFGRVVASADALGVDQWEARLGRSIGPDDVEAGTWYAIERARRLPAVDYLASLSWLHGYGRRMAAWWAEGFDVLVTPTLTIPPPGFGWFSDPAEGNRRVRRYIAFTAPFNITGQPAVSLPLGQTVDGLPIGVQLVGPAWGEALLIRLAAQLEQCRPWTDRHPPAFA